MSLMNKYVKKSTKSIENHPGVLHEKYVSHSIGVVFYISFFTDKRKDNNRKPKDILDETKNAIKFRLRFLISRIFVRSSLFLEDN